MQKLAGAAVLAAVLGLSACGNSDVERAATGAVIGGAAGQVLDGDPLTGALIGGAAGAMCDSVNACPQGN